ncbi:MAG: phage major capsid protein [Pseudorhodoplanes sp.]
MYTSDHPFDPKSGAPERETKALATEAVSSREMAEAYGVLLTAFEAFKDANDQRLADIESKLSADVLTTEKVERIDAVLSEQRRLLDALSLRRARPELERSAATREDARAVEHRAAFQRYVRQGDLSALSTVERKALSAGSDPDGGYLVPAETEQLIDSVLKQMSPIREIASVRPIGTSSYRKPVAVAGAESGWVGEIADRSQTEAPTLSLMEFPTMELYAMPAATQSLLDDAQVNVEDWLANEVQVEFAAQEGAAFVNGDGVNKPRGFLQYAKVADASWSWSTIGYVASGADGAFASSNPSDKLIELAYAPKQAYRAGASWVMNRKVESDIRKLKDGQGNYIWQPGAQAGQPATLLGYPVTEAEDMPNISSGSFSIAFGDFRRGYLIVDRTGIRILRDPFTAKPYVLFYTTKRVGGGVQNFEAIKLMKFSAS